MPITTGLLIFDGAEELDFVGPWEVFTVAAMLNPGDRVVTVAQESRPIQCAKGMRVLPDHTFADAPALDARLSQPHGVRRQGGVSLGWCLPNRQQLSN